MCADNFRSFLVLFLGEIYGKKLSRRICLHNNFLFCFFSQCLEVITQYHNCEHRANWSYPSQNCIRSYGANFGLLSEPPEMDILAKHKD